MIRWIGGPGEHGVRGAADHALGALGLQRSAAFTSVPGGVDHVVEDDAVACPSPRR